MSLLHTTIITSESDGIGAEMARQLAAQCLHLRSSAGCTNAALPYLRQNQSPIMAKAALHDEVEPR